MAATSSTTLRRSWLVFMAAALAAGCTGEPRVLSPRSPPPHVVPNVPVPNAPLPAGYGRVVLVGTDGPMKVTARADTAFVPPGTSLPPTRTGHLCTTPCVVNLPVGSYQLYMSSADGTTEGDVDVLKVHPGVNYYLRAPGKFDPPTWLPAVPVALEVVAAAALIGGVPLASSDRNGERAAGIGLLVGGAAVGIAGGIFYYNASRGARQEGATTSWWVPPNRESPSTVAPESVGH